MIEAASTVPPTWKPRRVRVGEWSITALADGWFRLDGGAMWGVVPAALWRPLTPPDEDNTILLALRCFLAERGDEKVLIEGGVGDRWSEKLRHIYRIARRPTLDDCLDRLDLEPADVTHCIASHCHWDHVGAWVVDRGGRLEPHFPNAQYRAPRVEIEAALDPDPIRRASYRSEDIALLVESGRLAPYEDGDELLPGLEARVLGGHSDGSSVLCFTDGDQRAAFLGDVVPTAHHIQPPYIMAYDLDPATSLHVRSGWIERMADEGWLGLFYHDPDVAFGRVERDGKRFAVQPVLGEDLSE